MASLIDRIQRAFLGSAGEAKVRALLVELAIPAGGSGGTMREVRRGFLRPISDEAILRDALANLGLSGGGGGGAQALSNIRTAILLSGGDETTLRDALDGLLAPGDLGEGEGGGNGAPDWVPADAVIHIDLVGGSPQGRAWTATDGEVAVDTLLGTDAGLEMWGDTGTYDPGNLVPAEGYNCVASVAFLGSLRNAVIGEATLVIQTMLLQEVPRLDFNVISADGENYLNCYFTVAESTGKVVAECGALYQETEDALSVVVGEINRIALTITSSRIEIAANGSAAVAGTFNPETDRPPGNPFSGVLLNTNSVLVSALQSITIYEPLPSTAGLSGLSEP